MIHSKCVDLNGNDLFKHGEKVYIHKSNQLPQYVGVLHKHNFIEITYIISGECVHIAGDSKCKLQQGDLMLINAGTPHMNIPTKAEEQFIAYDCAFTPDFIDVMLIGSYNFTDLNKSFLLKSMFPYENVLEPDIRVIGKEFDEFGELFQKMHEEYVLSKSGYIEIIRAYLIALFIKLFRELEGRSSKLTYEKQHVIDLVINNLKANYNADIRLEDIAFKSFLSKSYFRKLFFDATGMSFVKYLQQLRIDEACILLSTTDHPINEICTCTGFNDIKFFYNVFKRNKCMTPGEYRKKFK